MDEHTKEHLIAWAQKHVFEGETWRFISFAADLLQDADNLALYMDVGWQRLYDRFYNERLAKG